MGQVYNISAITVRQNFQNFRRNYSIFGGRTQRKGDPLATTKAQRAAMARYNEKTVQVLVRINPETERAVYERLMSQPNKSGYIKRLIARDASQWEVA